MMVMMVMTAIMVVVMVMSLLTILVTPMVVVVMVVMVARVVVTIVVVARIIASPSHLVQVINTIAEAMLFKHIGYPISIPVWTNHDRRGMRSIGIVRYVPVRCRTGGAKLGLVGIIWVTTIPKVGSATQVRFWDSQCGFCVHQDIPMARLLLVGAFDLPPSPIHVRLVLEVAKLNFITFFVQSSARSTTHRCLPAEALFRRHSGRAGSPGMIELKV
mmetsp:Transcript_22608/g.41643  ORF Transcript_22608/g.41643 Transcript_22608/m.41643 type:complete len:216 (+) Transcript_22608:643-1290(+)